MGDFEHKRSEGQERHSVSSPPLSRYLSQTRSLEERMVRRGRSCITAICLSVKDSIRTPIVRSVVNAVCRAILRLSSMATLRPEAWTSKDGPSAWTRVV